MKTLKLIPLKEGPLILFLLKGKLVSPSITLTDRRRAAFIPAGQIINFLAYEKGTVVYRVGIGVPEAYPRSRGRGRAPYF